MLAPYNISIVENGYEFITKNKLSYSVYFIDISDTLQSSVRVYSFGFGLVNYNGQIPPDEQVGHTIKKILDDFFCKNDYIIRYVPLEIYG